MTSPQQSVFLDYQGLDHMRRMDSGKGIPSSAELMALRQAAAGDIEAWMSHITLVEMQLGLEKPGLEAAKLALARQHDDDKSTIATAMHVGWLTYPASMATDRYSRSNLSCTIAGPDWFKANVLEEKLLKLPGVDPGDARQVVSCIYGKPVKGARRPAIRWFVSEDARLQRRLIASQADNAVGELAGLRVASVKTFVHSIVDHSSLGLEDC